jgi:hypothetical protein
MAPIVSARMLQLTLDAYSSPSLVSYAVDIPGPHKPTYDADRRAE